MFTLSTLFTEKQSKNIFFKDFIYLFDRVHAQAGRWQAEGDGEAGSPLSREPNIGLDPRMLGS